MLISLKADPEDGVSYAAVSFTTMNKSKGRVSCPIGCSGDVSEWRRNVFGNVSILTFLNIGYHSTSASSVIFYSVMVHVMSLYLYCVVSHQVQSKNYADEGDAVTYTTMKASSADPSNLYATINWPNKSNSSHQIFA